MRQLISAISLICVFTISDASAQMKRWTDENGILHFENKSPTVPERLAQHPTAQVNKRLERTYAGFTLGDDASAFRAARRGFSSGADKHGGEIFLFYPKFLPSRATKGTALFIDGRLALMEFVYRDYALDWDSTVKNTAAKYGEPRRVVDKASWTDGETGLVLKKDYSGNISASIGDRGVMSKYSERGASAPGF